MENENEKTPTVQDFELAKDLINTDLTSVENAIAQKDLQVDRDSIDEYIDAVKQYQTDAVSDNAFDLSITIEERKKKISEIISSGSIHDTRLDNFRAYVSADAVSLEDPNPAAGEYADYVEKRDLLREEIFGTSPSITSGMYAKSVKHIQESIGSESDVAKQYMMIDLRREMIQEHFDNPRFIAQVALHKLGERGDKGSLRDELLLDLGSERNTSKVAITRTSETAAYMARQTSAKSDSATQAFLQMQGVGAGMSSDHHAIMEFAASVSDESDNTGRSFNLGISAIEAKKGTTSVIDSFFKNYPDQVPKDLTGMFLFARKRFEIDFAEGNEGVGVSFAVMERAAEKIHGIGGLEIGKVVDADPKAADDLYRLSPATARQIRKSSENNLENSVSERVLEDSKEELDKKRNAEVLAAYVVTKDGQSVSFKPQAAVDPSISVIDGSRLEISYRNAGYAHSDAVERVSEATGINLANKSNMRKFLSGENEEFQSELMSSGIEGVSYGPNSNSKSKELAQKISKGESSKEDRVAYAFSLGLGDEVLNASGFGKERFSKLAAGDISVQDFQAGLTKSGITDTSLREVFGDGDAMTEAGLGSDRINDISRLGSADKGALARREVISRDAIFRLEGIVAPPISKKSDGIIDKPGLDSKAHLEGWVDRIKGDLKGSSLKFGRSADGSENTLSAHTPDGVNLSEMMLRDGYAIPLVGEASDRKEKLATAAESRRRGLWKDGMPEEDATWRRDRRTPALSEIDKKEKLFKTVGAFMAGTPDRARNILDAKESQLFALPIKEWVKFGNITEAVDDVTARNPSKVLKLYGNNMEILSDLRKRHKDGKSLTEEEKIAHDRLSLGRRVMAESLVSAGYMDKETAIKDSHPFLSRKGQTKGKGMREKLTKAGEKSMELAGTAITKGSELGKSTLNEAMNFAMGG
jgi:endonuclease YncB( thermonuclease family)